MRPEGDVFPDGGTESAAVCRVPEWKGALEEARKLHDRYVDALEEYVEFQEKNDDKILLWSTIRELLVESGDNDSIDPGDLFAALGLDTPSNPNVVRTIKDQLRIEPTVALLAKGMDAQRLLAIQNRHLKPTVPFVKFGRQYVYRQAAVTICAYQLIEYMKTGETDTSISSVEEAFELEPANLTHENAFYMAVKASPYAEQVRLAYHLLTDLDKCDVGREFLADLFEYRRTAIFDPFGFVPPLPVAWDNFGYFGLLQREPGIIGLSPGECLEDETVTIAMKHPDELQQYYTPNFRLKLSESNDAAESFAQHLLPLISTLQAGLGYFYATRIQDEAYMDGVGPDDDEHPKEIYTKFAIGVVSLFTNDDHIRNVIKQIDWPDGAEPDWQENAFRDFRSTGEFSEEAVVKFFAIAAAGGETFLSLHKVSGANFAAQLKGMLSVVVSFRVLIDLHKLGQMSDAEQIDAVGNLVGGVTDVASVVTHKTQRLGQFVRFLGVALNGFAAIFSFVEMGEAYKRDDDAWIGHGMVGVGFTIFFGLGAKSLAGMKLVALGIGSFLTGALLAVAVMLVIVGMIVAAIRTDGPIERWLKNTFFGIRWEKLKSDVENFVDPEQNADAIPDTYRYSEFARFGMGKKFMPTVPNFVRQTSGLFSTIRPIDVTTMEFGRERRDGEERWRGHIVVEAEDHQQLLTDGFFYLKPLKIYKELRAFQEPQPEYADLATDTCLHRFSLAEARGDARLQSRTALQVADPEQKKQFQRLGLNWLLEAIEEHKEGEFSSEDVDLEILNVDHEETDDGKMAVTKWEAKVWDMSGFGAHRIFGFQPEKLDTLDTSFFVEIIYVPPNLAETIESDGDLWFRPEELPAVSRDIARINLPSER